jgi:hypothetical protein
MLESDDTTVLVHYLEGQASRRLLTNEDGTPLKPPSKRRKASSKAGNEAMQQAAIPQQVDLPPQTPAEQAPILAQQGDAVAAAPPSLPSPADLSNMPVCFDLLCCTLPFFHPVICLYDGFFNCCAVCVLSGIH